MNLQGTNLIFGMQKCVSWTTHINNDLNGNKSKMSFML